MALDDLFHRRDFHRQWPISNWQIARRLARQRFMQNGQIAGADQQLRDRSESRGGQSAVDGDAQLAQFVVGKGRVDLAPDLNRDESGAGQIFQIGLACDQGVLNTACHNMAFGKQRRDRVMIADIIARRNQQVDFAGIQHLNRHVIGRDDGQLNAGRDFFDQRQQITQHRYQQEIRGHHAKGAL
jgi:hypothetical protein